MDHKAPKSFDFEKDEESLLGIDSQYSASKSKSQTTTETQRTDSSEDDDTVTPKYPQKLKNNEKWAPSKHYDEQPLVSDATCNTRDRFGDMLNPKKQYGFSKTGTSCHFGTAKLVENTSQSSVEDSKDDESRGNASKETLTNSNNENEDPDENKDDSDQNTLNNGTSKKKILSKDIKINMTVVKENEQHCTGFYLYEDQMKRKVQSTRMPNVCFNVNREYHSDPNTHVQIKVFEVSSMTKGNAGVDDEKIVGNFQLILRPDQRVKDLQFFDAFNNKIFLKLRRNSK